jgi:hypothetical protein
MMCASREPEVAVGFDGELETHVTVALDDDAPNGALARLRTWAASRGLKFTHIVLARGRTPSQPMLTQHTRGTLSDALALAGEMAGALRAERFVVSRVKVEATPWNAGVPPTDAEAAHHPPERYFEHHVKLLLLAGADVGPLAALAQRHAAHVSRNARRMRDDGRAERFVTQRCRGVGRDIAHARLVALRDALAGAGYEVIDVEEEFVVHDTNLAVDAGWIDADGEAQ